MEATMTAMVVLMQLKRMVVVFVVVVTG